TPDGGAGDSGSGFTTTDEPSPSADAGASNAGAAGDACSTYFECASGACVDGRCSDACDSSSSCGEGLRCDLAAGVCIAKGKLFGERCTAGDECADGECLAGADDAPICTRMCGDAGSCPKGWTCGLVSSERVCVPPRDPPAASCTASRSG